VNHPHVQAWTRESLPLEWHYQHNRRIAPFLLLPDPGWMLADKRKGGDDPQFPIGVHGYDIHDPDMHAVLIATGSAFKYPDAGTQIPAVNNTELYGAFARIMGITPAPHNGTGALDEWIYDPESNRNSMI
jgi:hypothetical protein